MDWQLPVANLVKAAVSLSRQPSGLRSEFPLLAINLKTFRQLDTQALDRDLERLRELPLTDPLMGAWRANLQIVLHEQRGELLQARRAIDQCDAIYDIQGIGFASFHLLIHRMPVNLAGGSPRLTAGDVGRMLKRRRAEFSSDVPVLSMARLAEASLC